MTKIPIYIVDAFTPVPFGKYSFFKPWMRFTNIKTLPLTGIFQCDDKA